MSAPQFDAIAPSMRARPQWICWKLEIPKDQTDFTKVPYNPRTEGKAISTIPSTWGSFGIAQRVYQRGGYTGIGYMFSADDPFVFVDLDHCRDADTGVLTEDAARIVRDFATYTEVSPSGTGLHLFCRGEITGDWHKRGGVEIYADKRFSTITGAVLEQSPVDVMPVNGPLHALYASIEPPPISKKSSDYARDAGAGAIPRKKHDIGGLPDEEVIRRASACSYGPKFAALMAGDARSYHSDSSADGVDWSGAELALCGYLAFWCRNDEAQIDRIFRTSKLLRPKWDRRLGKGTYGERTIGMAYSDEVYTPIVSTVPKVAEELERLRAELAAAQAMIAEQSAKLSEQQTLLDRLETGAPDKVLERLNEELALWKARYRTVVAVLECPDMTFKDKIVSTLALDVAAVVRVPPAFGVAPEPIEPVHVRIGELERRAGVAPGTTGPSLRKAQALGFLTREVHTAENPHRPKDYHKMVTIGPGTGVVNKKWREEQQAIKDGKERSAREEEARREELDKKAEEERRHAAERAHQGCLCGGDLLPTGYVCASCQNRLIPARVLAMPDHARRDAEWRNGVIPPETITKKSSDGSYNYSSPKKQDIGDGVGFGPDGGPF